MPLIVCRADACLDVYHAFFSQVLVRYALNTGLIEQAIVWGWTIRTQNKINEGESEYGIIC
jgi:hypothetical protein